MSNTSNCYTQALNIVYNTTATCTCRMFTAALLTDSRFSSFDAWRPHQTQTPASPLSTMKQS